ncbi:MAG TPA: cytochrome c oxidase subunit I [Candidatus Limnocylindrales bacterium]|nr:cytochrome c oxidase subunit I [Candidatus Limnocylindrales bacterium]
MATHALNPAVVPAYRGRLYEWLTTTDHKKIGILYVINSFLMFFIGGVLALVVRTELAQPGLQIFEGNELGYNEMFSIHATVMIFLFIIPMLAGLGNYVVPLMIGAPDMAFPRINALSFWMLPLGAILLLMGFFVPGGAAAAGWTSYPPLTERLELSAPGAGQDLWIVSLVLIGTSSILGGINFLVTIFKMRAPGMTLFRMPIMVWTVLVFSVLVVMATPVFTSALVMLFIDRNYGGTFFLPPQGQAVLYQNIFWFYSHPAVYVMVLPAMGVISEVLPVFSRKPLFGYKAFIFATAGIGALGFTVWAHHMFTTGAVFLPFFSLMTAAIGVPTGVKMFNWVFTMFRGQLTFSTPLIFAIGFLTMFLIGGINGVFSAAVPVDFALHDTYWVVAHLHYVLFGGSVFGVFAGIYYWFPKMSGRMLDEGLGKIHFWLMFIGFNLTFFPMHMLGIKGMPRRIADYASDAGWNDWNLAATIGGFMIGISMLPFLWNVFVSLRNGKIAGDDPWEGNTLEWATSSPPPPYNFDRLPEIRSERPLFDARHGLVDPHATAPIPPSIAAGEDSHPSIPGPKA